MEQYIPFIIILTFPIFITFVYQLIKRSKRLVFLFDDKLLKSPIKLSTVLLGVALLYVLYSYMLLTLFNVEDRSSYIWNLIGLLVSASHFVKTKGASTNYIILYLFTMFIGLFVYGIFISNLVGYVKERLKKLSKGRTNVLEEQHILITGKSEYMYPIIDQYVRASIKIKEKRIHNLLHRDIIRKQKIVILDNIDPEKNMNEVEKRVNNLISSKYDKKEIKRYEKELENKLIYRQGSPFSVHDLNMCNIEKAQSVIVLGSDEQKIKTILAIGATNFKANEESFVISKFNEKEYLDTAERNDLGDEYDLIDINHLISNLTAQTTIQPNLSYIYEDLLDFSKTSIEFIKIQGNSQLESMVGKSFDEISLSFSNVILLGIKKDKIIINPKADGQVKIDINDSLIIIRDPKVSLEINSNYEQFIDQSNIDSKIYPFKKEILNLVLVGYSKNIKRLINEFNGIVDSKSQITILFKEKHKSKINTEKIKQSINVDFNIDFRFYNSFDQFQELISELDQGNDIDSVIVLPNDFLDKKTKDEESVFTLLDLKYLEKQNKRDYNITVDLAEISNLNIIEHMNIADVIISDKFASELIFQYATHRDIKSVYDELFSIEGDEIYSIPVSKYITDLSKPVNFYTLSKSALLKNEIAIGYKTNNQVSIITIDKDKDILFDENDHLIVISKGH